MSSWVNYDDVLSQLSGAHLDLREDSRHRPLTFDGQIQRWLVMGEDKEYRGWTRLREWTSAAGHTYIVGAYGVWRGADDGYTKIEMPRRDKDAARPALTEALSTLRAGTHGVLVVAKRDRLARDVVIAGWIDREAERLGAAVVAADGAGNERTPQGEFLRTVLDGAAQLERRRQGRQAGEDREEGRDPHALTGLPREVARGAAQGGRLQRAPGDGGVHPRRGSAPRDPPRRQAAGGRRGGRLQGGEGLASTLRSNGKGGRT
jgi:hypothetical protein